MKIELAQKYGFCFGVKRAIKMAENAPNATTSGPLIHNNQEINRLKVNFNVKTAHTMDEINNSEKVIIRTHGIPKEDLRELKQNHVEVVDATCPYVTKPQQICEEMSQKGYQIIIFGDESHPEVKGVRSYCNDNSLVTPNIEHLQKQKLKNKVAIVSQTTKKHKDFANIVNYLMLKCREVRVFNTICDATLENQDAILKLSQKADVMIIIGGKDSSNTKQLHAISKTNCDDSYHIESTKELQKSWFENKNLCGISAGASTPEWIIEEIMGKIRNIAE